MKYSEVRGGRRAVALLVGLSHHPAAGESKEYGCHQDNFRA